MRVCFIAPQSLNMVAGGPQTQLLNTKLALQELGVEVCLFNQWEKFEPNKFDLYHLFVGTMLNYDIAMRLQHFNQKFVVSSIFYTMRTPGFMRYSLHTEKLFSKLFSGIRTDYKIAQDIFKASSHVLPNTNSEADLIINGLSIPKEKVTLIPNGVDKNFLNSDKNLFAETYGITDFVLNVGHIGSLRKNVLGLINVMKDIDEKCVIIGKIHKNEYSEKCLLEAKKNKNILMIDGLDNNSEMLNSAYHNAKVFTLPSLFETPGIAALEAGLAGCNVSITKHGGTTEYFKNYVSYLEPKNADSIRNSILNELKKDKNEELKKHIEANFLWEKVAQKTLDVYKKVLSN